MGRRVGSALLVALTAVLLPSAARAWVRFLPVAPQAPAGEPETAPAEQVPPETIAPPETVTPPAPPPVPPSAPSPPFETAPPPSAVPPPVESPAQAWTWAEPEPTAVLEALARAPAPRPRLSAAVGMGVSYDSVGFSDGNAHEIPAFFSMLGIGEGVLGFDLGAFAGSAKREDRAAQKPIDRLAVDAYGVFRPGAWVRPDDRSFDMRLLHALAAELGLGFERDGRSAISGTRFLIHVGAHADLPLSPTSEPTEVRLRLAVRRAIGLYTPRLSSRTMPDVLEVADSAVEVYVALVAVF